MEEAGSAQEARFLARRSTEEEEGSKMYEAGKVLAAPGGADGKQECSDSANLRRKQSQGKGLATSRRRILGLGSGFLTSAVMSRE